MGQEPGFTLHEDLLELRDALEADWPAHRAALHATGVPLCEGDDDASDKADEDADDDKGDDADNDAKTFPADYVKKLRDENAKHRKAAADARAHAKQLEDKDKSEAEKLQERATEAERKATASTLELARMRVALRKGLTESQAKRLIGDSEEDLEADADELLASFKTEDEGARGATSGRPRERLRPGAAPSAEAEETDPAKLAAMVPRRY